MDEPFILFLDDIQWCDTDTLSWLRYFLHLDKGAKILLIFTLHAEELSANSELGRYSSVRNSNTKLSNIICNADMRIGEIRQFCKLQDDGKGLMQAAMSQLNLSARAYDRILKLARTMADLPGCEKIQSPHLAEALQYRPKLMIG